MQATAGLTQRKESREIAQESVLVGGNVEGDHRSSSEGIQHERYTGIGRTFGGQLENGKVSPYGLWVKTLLCPWRHEISFRRVPIHPVKQTRQGMAGSAL